jgi:lincosamide nucleotidyltransferase A/C/D/E
VPGTGDTASIWTRFTDRVNALIWEVPLPRRPKVLLSEVVFRNPPMPRARVLEVLSALETAGLGTVMLGGWGIDALVGRQLRKHRDLDLVVGPRHFDQAVEALQGLGFEPWNEDDAPLPFGPLKPERTATCRDRALRVVDLHGADLATLDLTDGLIGNREVTCLSAEQQLQTQVGKCWTPGRLRRRRGNLAALRTLLATKAG